MAVRLWFTIAVGVALYYRPAWTLAALAIGSLVLALLVCATIARAMVRSVFELPRATLQVFRTITGSLVSIAARGFSPLMPNWTLSFEVLASVMRLVMVEHGELVAHEHPEMLRTLFERLGKWQLPSSCKKHGTVAETVEFNGLQHWWLRDTARTGERLVVVIFHGGGYTVAHPLQDVDLGNNMHSQLQKILQDKYGRSVSVDVLLANYRKSPEHPYPTPLEDCEAAYKYVLKTEGISPKQVIISGDSAGAEMAFSVCKRLRDAGKAELLPVTAVLYSPDLDLDARGDPFGDAVLDMYMRNISDPEERRMISPINCSLRDLPPMYFQFGELESYVPDGKRLMVLAKAEGVTTMEMEVLKCMPHDCVMFPTAVLPFAIEAVQHACEFAAKVVASA
jgi:acetyl esterase/lipase